MSIEKQEETNFGGSCCCWSAADLSLSHLDVADRIEVYDIDRRGGRLREAGVDFGPFF